MPPANDVRAKSGKGSLRRGVMEWRVQFLGGRSLGT